MKTGSFAFALTLLAASAAVGLADDFAPGRFGADAIFVAPVGSSIGSVATDSTVRASFSVEPVEWDSQVAKIEFPVIEGTISTRIGDGHVDLTKARATALRVALSYVTPLDLLSVYRDMDRGIDIGGDIVSLKVPIRITPNGEIILQPGFDFGVRHYVAPIDQTTVHASFSLDARAAVDIIKNFLSTGIMGRIRYDLDSTKMSGFEEEGMGYLSLLLDRNHRLYGRVYVGIDHQEARENLGLPTTNVFTGIGVIGNFGTR